MFNVKKIATIAVAAIVVSVGIGVVANAAITNSVEQKDDKSALKAKLKNTLIALNQQLKNLQTSCGDEQGLEATVCRANMTATSCRNARLKAISKGICKADENVAACTDLQITKTELNPATCTGLADLRSQIEREIASAQANGLSLDEINQILAEVQNEIAVADIGDTERTLTIIDPASIPDNRAGYSSNQ